MDIILYLIILLLGAFIGNKNLFNKSTVKKLDHMQTLSLLLLLFIMGISIGLDKEVISSLPSIGLQAAIITIFSVLFSIICVKLVSKKVMGQEEEGAGHDS